MVNKIQELVFSFMDMVNIKRSEIESGIWMARIPAAEQAFSTALKT